MRKTLLLLFICAALQAWSIGYHQLRVNLTGGEQVSIELSEDLKVSFTEENLEAHGVYADVVIPRVNIVDFEHLEESGVDIIGAESGVQRVGNSLTFTGLADNSEISVIDMGGRLVSSEKASGQYTLSLDGLTAGVYVVRVNNMSYKVTVK